MLINKPTFESWFKANTGDNSFVEFLAYKGEYENIGLMKDLSKLKKKSKYYTFVVYPDNIANMKFKEYLELSGHYDFAYILHETPDTALPAPCPLTDTELDRGYIENTLSKPHYHVLVKFGYSMEWATVVKKLYPWGITYCEPVASIDDMLIYFTHCDSTSIVKGKEKYKFDDIVYTGEFIDRIARLQNRQNCKNIINPRNDLLEYAYVCESYYEFYKYAMSDAFLDKEFRTHQLTFENILRRRKLE